MGNEGNLDLADGTFDRYLAHQPDESVLERGPEDLKWFMGEFRSAFPDFHTTISTPDDPWPACWSTPTSG